MKKTLSAEAQKMLADAVVTGGGGLNLDTLLPMAELLIGGYLKAGESLLVRPTLATTKGVRFALRAKLVKQDGIEFTYPDGSRPPQAATLAQLSPAPLRLVPPKPRDPFDEGFTAAKDGQPASNDWQDQTQASEYDEGFRQGAMWRVQNPPAASA